MREALRDQEGIRGTFSGIVARFGTKSAYRGAPIPTVLLQDVKDPSGKVVADHLWLTVGLQIQRLSLQVGEEVVFDARVTQYEKGYKGYREDVYDAPIEVDYRLSNPTKVRRKDYRRE